MWLLMGMQQDTQLRTRPQADSGLEHLITTTSACMPSRPNVCGRERHALEAVRGSRTRERRRVLPGAASIPCSMGRAPKGSLSLPHYRTTSIRVGPDGAPPCEQCVWQAAAACLAEGTSAPQLVTCLVMRIALRLELGAAGPACRTPCSGPGGCPQRCKFMQLKRSTCTCLQETHMRSHPHSETRQPTSKAAASLFHQPWHMYKSSQHDRRTPRTLAIACFCWKGFSTA